MTAKRFVFEFANDIIKTDAANKLMREDIKAARKAEVNEIVFEHKEGFISSVEAVNLIANLGNCLSRHRESASR